MQKRLAPSKKGEPNYIILPRGEHAFERRLLLPEQGGPNYITGRGFLERDRERGRERERERGREREGERERGRVPRHTCMDWIDLPKYAPERVVPNISSCALSPSKAKLATFLNPQPRLSWSPAWCLVRSTVR